MRNAHCTYYEGQTGLCKAKEFVKCNPVNCKLYTIDELSTIVDLQEQLKAKEYYQKECEELKKERDTLSATRNKLLDDLWVVEENLKDYTEHFNKASDELDQLKAENEELKQTLTEIKPILELYANSKIGEEQLDGTYKITVKNSNVLGETYITFDPRPAKQALQKISECEVEND